jgi:hypothetical protein
MRYVSWRPQDIIRRLNPIIWGWSNYFLPSPNQYKLRSKLDQYIFRRCTKWCYRVSFYAHYRYNASLFHRH